MEGEQQPQQEQPQQQEESATTTAHPAEEEAPTTAPAAEEQQPAQEEQQQGCVLPHCCAPVLHLLQTQACSIPHVLAAPPQKLKPKALMPSCFTCRPGIEPPPPEDDIVGYVPGYQMPNISSMLPTYTNSEQDFIRNTFHTGNYDYIKHLPADIKFQQVCVRARGPACALRMCLHMCVCSVHTLACLTHSLTLPPHTHTHAGHTSPGGAHGCNQAVPHATHQWAPPQLERHKPARPVPGAHAHTHASTRARTHHRYPVHYCHSVLTAQHHITLSTHTAACRCSSSCPASTAERTTWQHRSAWRVRQSGSRCVGSH